MTKLFQENQSVYLSRNNTNCIKGFFAIIVVLAHIRGQLTVLNNTIIGQILTASGYLSVAVFFFISGYGLQFSYAAKREMYINTFFQNRIFPFYCICLFNAAVYILFYMIVGNTSLLELRNILSSVILGPTIIQNGWYLQTILLFYFCFWQIYRLFSSDNQKLLAVVFCMFAYCLLCLIQGRGPYSYVSVFAFPMGILWCHKQDQIDKMLRIKKNYFLWLILNFVFFCITLLLGNYPILPKMCMITLRCLSSLFFVLCVLMLVMKIRISFSILQFLGRISSNIYTLHGIFILLFKDNFPILNPFLYTIFVLVCSITLSYLLYPIVQFITERAKRLITHLITK